MQQFRLPVHTRVPAVGPPANEGSPTTADGPNPVAVGGCAAAEGPASAAAKGSAAAATARKAAGGGPSDAAAVGVRPAAAVVPVSAADAGSAVDGPGFAVGAGPTCKNSKAEGSETELGSTMHPHSVAYLVHYAIWLGL